jgi:hypothetical protein
MTLPATFTEAEARLFTRKLIAACRDLDLFNTGRTVFDPQAGHAFLHTMMKKIALTTPEGMLWILDCARAGWSDADAALRQLVLDFANRGEPLPAFLATYAAEVVTGRTARAPTGRAPRAYFVHDMFIVITIAELVARFNLKATRSAAARRRPSAASIAADSWAEAGLHRGAEKAFNKIWQRYGKAATRAAMPGGWSRLIEEMI